MKFKITDEFGGVTHTDAPTKGSVIEDLQRMGCMHAGVVIEEVVPGGNVNTSRVNTSKAPKAFQSALGLPPGSGNPEERIFTIPGTNQKIKDVNGVLYGLEWRQISLSEIMVLIDCEDLKIKGPDETTEIDMDISILDWIELEQEKEPEDEIREDNNSLKEEEEEKIETKEDNAIETDPMV